MPKPYPGKVDECAGRRATSIRYRWRKSELLGAAVNRFPVVNVRPGRRAPFIVSRLLTISQEPT